jgi:hypothetical protein
MRNLHHDAAPKRKVRGSDFGKMRHFHSLRMIANTHGSAERTTAAVYNLS